MEQLVIACGRCGQNYDLTGYEANTEFQCACGETLYHPHHPGRQPRSSAGLPPLTGGLPPLSGGLPPLEGGLTGGLAGMPFPPPPSQLAPFPGLGGAGAPPVPRAEETAPSGASQGLSIGEFSAQEPQATAAQPGFTMEEFLQMQADDADASEPVEEDRPDSSPSLEVPVSQSASSLAQSESVAASSSSDSYPGQAMKRSPSRSSREAVPVVGPAQSLVQEAQGDDDFVPMPAASFGQDRTLEEPNAAIQARRAASGSASKSTLNLNKTTVSDDESPSPQEAKGGISGDVIPDDPPSGVLVMTAPRKTSESLFVPEDADAASASPSDEALPGKLGAPSPKVFRDTKQDREDPQPDDEAPLDEPAPVDKRPSPSPRSVDFSIEELDAVVDDEARVELELALKQRDAQVDQLRKDFRQLETDYKVLQAEMRESLALVQQQWEQVQTERGEAQEEVAALVEETLKLQDGISQQIEQDQAILFEELLGAAKQEWKAMQESFEKQLEGRLQKMEGRLGRLEAALEVDLPFESDEEG